MPAPAAAAGASAAASAAPRIAGAAAVSVSSSGGEGGQGGGGGGAAKLGLGLLAGLLVFLLLVLAPLLVFFGSSSASSCEGGQISTRFDERTPDPETMRPLEIASRAYLVAIDMGLGRREILTAYATIMVETGGGVSMANPHAAVDHTSVGAYQQQDFPPWNERERLNVAAASRTFYEQLQVFDRGQPIGELAADIQRPREDLRYKYALALPGARRFYDRVAALQLSGAGPVGDDAIPAGCGAGPIGDVDLGSAETLHEPRSYKALPAGLISPGRPVQAVDERIWDTVVWALRHYRMTVNAARESGHATHGDGTAVDLQPADPSSIRNWRRSTERFARDLGWDESCAYQPSCDFAPAIQFVGYNGFSDGRHGDPAHTNSPHLHVSWRSSCYGCGGGGLVEPREWVKVFAEAPQAAGGRHRDGGRR